MDKLHDARQAEPVVSIIGGGLAGCEAAWQAAAFGCRVILHEMKPERYSPAHHSSSLAELVCSNSLRSDAPDSAVGLLKDEMRALGSLVIRVAERHRVPAGKALAVDRELFAAFITETINQHPRITVVHHEVGELPSDCGLDPANPLILATGPLTTDALTNALGAITGQEYLAFYDAIAPIIATDSLDRTIIYQASRYDDGPGDYLNCPFDREQYQAFIEALGQATSVPLKPFEEPKYFEGCLPIEVMLARGPETLRFGPMKPVGLPDPRTGRDPFAVVQLRKENVAGDQVNMVGFQTKLTYSEQKRVFAMIPGLERAEFTRLGSIHRNTFVCAPKVLTPFLQIKGRPGLLLAGQITGVEGYVESTAMGILAGRNAACLALGLPLSTPSPETAHGALLGHLTQSEAKHFQPSNVNFGLFPAFASKLPKRQRGQYRAQKALAALAQWQTSPTGRPLD
ncbi:MAG: methylenetetrahydrofolate--tRNA-(uracil(54)-C(5))-methyltransferase (FADH(2)-oxidizing) TrmFO [Desulfobulbaceae bacterium]|nr:methylenetetrahydrofolate--tRNA-(uracil(54)-C(5))-methyltransferase (FADH(2)-oxidizing) TrmFO [Desulfobulbaceae bacterium]